MRRVLAVALLLAAVSRAGEEPTPFWMPPPAKKVPLQEKRKVPPPDRPLEPIWIEPAPHAADPSPQPKRAPAESEPAAAAPPAVAAPSAVAAPPAAAEAAAPEQPAAAAVARSEPEAAAEKARRWSVDASFGAWGKSRSDGGGRDWQLAYGLRFGRSLLPALEVEIQLLRAGGRAGNPFVSASTTLNLAALRAFWVLGASGDPFALLLGGGGGAALAQTHYTLQPSTDANAVAAGLDAAAVKSVIEITAALRARILRGLEVRAEVSAAARDGKLELLPLLGAGAAF